MEEPTAASTDAALQLLLDDLLAFAVAPDRLEAALAASADPDRLLDVMSAPLQKLAMSVVSRPHFQKLIQAHPALESRLSEARKVIIRAFPGIALAVAIAPDAIDLSVDAPTLDVGFLRAFSHVQHATMWVGRRDALAAAVRIVVTDVSGDRALDAVVDWTDLAFLAASTLAVLQDSMTEGVDLVAPQHVAGLMEILPETIERVNGALREIMALAVKLQNAPHRSRVE